jgi:hypothetical protein
LECCDDQKQPLQEGGSRLSTGTPALLVRDGRVAEVGDCRLAARAADAGKRHHRHQARRRHEIVLIENR